MSKRKYSEMYPMTLDGARCVEVAYPYGYVFIDPIPESIKGLLYFDEEYRRWRARIGASSQEGREISDALYNAKRLIDPLSDEGKELMLKADTESGTEIIIEWAFHYSVYESTDYRRLMPPPLYKDLKDLPSKWVENYLIWMRAWWDTYPRTPIPYQDIRACQSEMYEVWEKVWGY